MSFSIGPHTVGADTAPFIIAEMSGNHNQSLERALEIVDAVADAGAHALKLQTYTADTMTIDIDQDEFWISDPSSQWEGNSLYKLYQLAYTPWEWHEPIFKRARERGLAAFSSPFDATAVEFLESLDVPAYKIASFECVDIPLIQRVAQTGKPVIISTGMADQEEIAEAVAAARNAGCKNLVLLKCTSNYPATPESSNLKTIAHLREKFGCEAGLSDHTMGIGAAVASVALGATVIEKHVTLSRADGGVDSAFSLEPAELAQLVAESKTAWQSVGNVQLGPTQEEINYRTFRRSLYICEDVQAGDVLTEKNLRAIRPGLGLPPKHLPELLGKRVKKSAKRGTPMAWEIVD